MSHIATKFVLICYYLTQFHNAEHNGPVAQRIRHLTTNQGIAGSSPARVKFLFPLFSTVFVFHEEKYSAPGWARTTNLSVNSRTR